MLYAITLYYTARKMNLKKVLMHTKNGWLIILKREMLFLLARWKMERVGLF